MMVEKVCHIIIEIEIKTFIGVDSYEQTGYRIYHRNGYKKGCLKLRLGR